MHCGSRIAPPLCDYNIVISGLSSCHLLCAVGLPMRRGRRCSRSASAASFSVSGESAPAIPTALAFAGPSRRAHSSAAVLQPSSGSSATLLQPTLDSDLQPVLAGAGAGSRDQPGSHPVSTPFPGELAQDSVAQSVFTGASPEVSPCSPSLLDSDSLIRRRAFAWPPMLADAGAGLRELAARGPA